MHPGGKGGLRKPALNSRVYLPPLAFPELPRGPIRTTPGPTKGTVGC
jgi:hypothetical protein